MNRFPWWGSVLLAVLAYCGLKYGMVQLMGQESRLISLIRLIAPLAAMGFLLLAGKQLYDEDEKEQNAGEQADDTANKPSGK